MLTICKCRALPGTLNSTLKTAAPHMMRNCSSDVKLLLRAMKITSAILLIFSMHVTATGVSQTITLKGKDIPLKTVFAEIKKQSGYMVFYNEDLLDDAK